MEHARSTPITALAAIIIVIHHVITGETTSIQSSTPLKIVAITANLTEIARIAIEQESVLLKVTMDLGLALSNRACALLMSSNIMKTNAEATRTNPTRMSIVQVTAEILTIPIHVHNIKAGIHTETHNDANLIATLDRLVVSTVIKDKLETMTETVDSLAVMIMISGHLVMQQDPIHITSVGRVDRQGNMTILQKSPMNLHDTEQKRSYSKATMSILM